jgi:hypothetical protein
MNFQVALKGLPLYYDFRGKRLFHPLTSPLPLEGERNSGLWAGSKEESSFRKERNLTV